MNKKSLVVVSVIAGLVLVGGGVMAYTNNQNQKEEKKKMAMEQEAEDAATMKQDEAAAMNKEPITTEDQSMEKDAAMIKKGSYVTLAEYNKDPSKYADSDKVYFFHASWCSVCKGIDEEINDDMSKIPSGVTIIKTDFDSSTDLRKKYGITTQYTFVQVDTNGNETAQWSATSLDAAIDGIQT